MSVVGNVDLLAARIADEINAIRGEVAVHSHAASAITNTPAGTIAATNVQTALNELDTEKATTGSVTTVQTNLTNHITDITSAHDSGSIGVVSNLTTDPDEYLAGITDVFEGLLDHGGRILGLEGHIHTASGVTFTPNGSIAATNVQTAIQEVRDEAGAAASETVAGIAELATQAETNTGTDDTRTVTPLKLQTRLAAYAQPLDTDLSAIGALTSAADKVPYATGAGTWALATQTSFARTFLDDADAAAVRATLGASAEVLDTNVQTGTTYTLALSDIGKVVQGNHATGITITIPPVATIAFPVGTVIEIFGRGAGTTTIAAPAVALNSMTNTGDIASFVLPHRYSLVRLWQRATDVWVMSGNVTQNMISLAVGAGVPTGTPSGTIIVRY